MQAIGVLMLALCAFDWWSRSNWSKRAATAVFVGISFSVCWLLAKIIP